MKRIAFVDYRLENYHANVFLDAFRTTLKERGFEVSACHALDQANGRTWAEKNQVPYCSDLLKLDRQADYYMILAPSNPETHWALAQMILPFGKPTYIDKTFAPNLKTAKDIFALADRHGTAVQTSSALRYTAAQQRVARIGREHLRGMVASGGGSNFDEYIIHPVEMVVSCMGPEVIGVRRQLSIGFEMLRIEFSGRRNAEAIFRQGDHPFVAHLATTFSRTETETIKVDSSQLFVNAASGILDFFDAGRALIDRAESLAIRSILDAGAGL